MLGAKVACPQCKEKITPSTAKCPKCRNIFPKKYLEQYKKAETKFWLIFLGGFLLFLSVPFLFYDLLGSTWTGFIILAGIPISFLAGYFTMLSQVYSSKG